MVEKVTGYAKIDINERTWGGTKDGTYCTASGSECHHAGGESGDPE